MSEKKKPAQAGENNKDKEDQASEEEESSQVFAPQQNFKAVCLSRPSMQIHFCPGLPYFLLCILYTCTTWQICQSLSSKRFLSWIWFLELFGLQGGTKKAEQLRNRNTKLGREKNTKTVLHNQHNIWWKPIFLLLKLVNFYFLGSDRRNWAEGFTSPEEC